MTVIAQLSVDFWKSAQILVKRVNYCYRANWVKNSR